MKSTFPIGLTFIVFLLMLVQPALAQSESTGSEQALLQFVENKGQWNKDVLYKADLDGSNVYLKKKSIVYQLLNRDDLLAITDQIHGHKLPDDIVNGGGGGGTPVEQHPNARKQAGEGGATGGQPTQPGSMILRSHAYEVNFINANDNARIVPSKPNEGYANYFIGNDKSKWATNVVNYQNVTYQQLYPFIDMLVYSEAGQLKYDMVVYPGGDVNSIQFEYNGATKIQLQKNQLYVETSVGHSYELQPYAYQFVNNERVEVKVKYQLDGNRLSYKVTGKYNKAFPLIIDPTVVFSTLTGSKADNWGYTATYDPQGNFYAGGIVFGNGEYPTTLGAISRNYMGGFCDIAITKFTSNGRNIHYSTYIGGAGTEQPHSLIVDAQNNLIISGRTDSPDFPVDSGSIGGGLDMVVMKLNATGTGIIGGIRLGGSGNDGVNSDPNKQGLTALKRNYGDDARSEVLVDAAGFIYAVGCTQSSNFPQVGNTFQRNKNSGQDGVVVKLNPNCSSIVWSSFLGGSGDDAAFVIALNGTNSLYVAGVTTSNNLPMAGTPLQATHAGGGADGFVYHISADGGTILHATYLGTNRADMLYGVQIGREGHVYVMGTTEGTWPIVRIPGNARFYNDNSKQYISKLQPDLSAFVYSTTFGKEGPQPTLSPVAFLVDRCENVYISGWGGGYNVGNFRTREPSAYTYGLPITADAKYRTTDGADFYFFVLQRDAVDKLYATFFGAREHYEHVDGGTSRFDYNGVIYQSVCSSCSQSPVRFPTTAGAYASANPPFCNLAAIKIAFNLDGVRAQIRTNGRKQNYCSGDEITAQDTSSTVAQSWEWSWGDGTPLVTTTTNIPVSHIYAANGDYTIRLVKFDPGACNVRDTAYYPVRIRSNRAQLGFTVERKPPCNSLTYVITNTSTAPPGIPFTNASFVWDMGDGTAPFTRPDLAPFEYQYPEGIYNIKLSLVDANYCNAPEDSIQQIRVAGNVKAQFDRPADGCAPYFVQFNNTSLAGQTFIWNFGDGSPTTNTPYPEHTFQNPGVYQVHLQAFDPTTCNQVHDTIIPVVVNGNPRADFIFSPQQPMPNTPVSFTNTSMGAQKYYWTFGDGDTSILVNPVHQYNRTNSYEACLVAINQFGCEDTTCQPVSAIVIPKFDVPSAFSPNNDNINDVFLVKSFGAVRFNLKVFNRWGELVFESNDPNMGWDGRYKGALQPMDAYGYVVYIEFTDGTKGSRTGNVTLLR
ncbi:gliding motility-associated-like protein [Chitinophaga skermanii]|uniref:Gliding motility-associated-like protein n=1 Tax=Chitinophaga skermanii TaxID=331697 RepID=A0A327Q639_9BACT|nr:PKD domain-containing protein [Chitinophaga skermanii]RAI99918.1 gliding motility-associated-like protein [Chitinophaga skermanii]